MSVQQPFIGCNRSGRRMGKVEPPQQSAFGCYGIREDPVYDEWHRRYNGDLTVGINQYYSKALPRTGSFERMFWEDAIEPGNEYLNRRSNTQIIPQDVPGLPSMNAQTDPFYKMNIETWGQGLRENTYSNNGQFSNLSTAYWENPWDVYLYDKTYSDWVQTRPCIANAGMAQRRWFS